MAKEAQLPARFLGPNKVPIGRYELSINLIDMLKELKPLKIRFESSTMALTNSTTFGLAVRDTAFAVEVEVSDQ